MDAIVDLLQLKVEKLEFENARLREALEQICTPNSIPNIYDCDSWADEVAKIAKKALDNTTVSSVSTEVEQKPNRGDIRYKDGKQEIYYSDDESSGWIAARSNRGELCVWTELYNKTRFVDEIMDEMHADELMDAMKS